MRGMGLKESDDDREFDRESEKERTTGKGWYGRVVVWPPEAATSDSEEPVSVIDSLEKQPARPADAGSTSLGRGGKLSLLRFNSGERQRVRRDVWDIRARRRQDILLAVLIWIAIALVEVKYGVLQFALAGFPSETAGLRGGRGGGLQPVVYIALVLVSLTNNGVVLDRRSATAWFWSGLFGVKDVKAVPIALLRIKREANVAWGGIGGGRTVTLCGPKLRMRVFKGDEARAKDYSGRLEAFIAGRDMDFEYKGTMTARDILGWLMVSFCILVALWMEYLD